MDNIRMYFQATLIAVVVSCLWDTIAVADTLHVVPGNPDAAMPYADWSTAAADIQTAVNAAADGDTVLVADGSYVLSSNISITKGVTVRSVNGATDTVIDGNGVARCVYMNHADAVLDGFTVCGGHNPGGFGGGVNIATGGTVQNCILRNNRARDGGGVAVDNAGLVVNCVIHDNLAADGGGSNGYGGGVRLLNGGTVRGCLIVNNESRKYGGGVNIWNAGRVENCTIVSNLAPNGAGIRTRQQGIVINTIIYNNIGLDWDLSGAGYSYTNCCTPNAGALPGSGNISNEPLYADALGGDYRLQDESPCLDAGILQDWMAGASDLDGHARVVGTAVDIGAYELVPSIVYTIDASAAVNGGIAPAGDIAVLQDASQTFSILPNEGYAVQDVVVDGISVGAVTSYTFSAVSANHSISAVFAPASWQKADFVISEIYFVDVESPAPGENFRLRVKIENKGDIAGDGGYVHFWAADPYEAATATLSIPVGELEPGQSITRSRLLAAPPAAGTYLARGLVVTDTQEKSAGNNANTITYTMHAAAEDDGGEDETPDWMKPDFVVTEVLLLPQPTETGQSFEAVVTVLNQGDIPGDAGQLRIWAQDGGAPEDRSIGILDVDETVTIACSLSAPATLGSYNVQAHVDADGLSAEKSEGNNLKSASYTLHAPADEPGDDDEDPEWKKADFVITDIYFVDVDSPALGENFRLRVRIENKGDIAGDGGYVNFWAAAPYEAASTVVSIPVGELEPGQGITRSRLLAAPPAAGTYLARGLVVTDTSEKSAGNNAKTITYTMHAVAEDEGGDDETPDWMKPDFVVTDFVFDPLPTVTDAMFDVHVTVLNKGDVAGDAGNLRLWLSEASLAAAGQPGDAESPVGTLSVDESRTISFSGIRTGDEAGWHHFRAFIDADNVAAEKSEGNNQKSQVYRTWYLRTIVTPHPDGFQLEWNSRPGLSYRVMRMASPGEGFEVVASGIESTPPTNTFIDTSPPAAVLIYQVEVEQ